MVNSTILSEMAWIRPACVLPFASLNGLRSSSITQHQGALVPVLESRRQTISRTKV